MSEFVNFDAYGQKLAIWFVGNLDFQDFPIRLDIIDCSVGFGLVVVRPWVQILPRAGL